MAESTSELVLHRLNAAWAGVQERLARFFYTDDSYEMVDVLNVMLLCWAIVGLLVYFVGTVLTNRLGRARAPAPTIKTTPDDGLDDVEGPVASQRSATAQLGAAARKSQAEVFSSFPVHATGSDPDAVLWTNRILAWLLGRKEHQFISEPWIQALNEKLARSPSKHGVVVEFECVHPDSTKPKLHDVHVVLESKESLTVTTGITCERVILVIKVKRPNDADKAMHRYNLLIEKLSGKLKVCCISTEQLFVVRFVQRPDIKVSLHSGTGENKPHSVDQRALDDIVLESVVDALSYTVTDLSCSGQKDFPNFKHREPVSEIIQHTQLDQMNSVPSLAKHDQRLLVKVIKASNLAGTKGCKEVYCVVELDEPPHRCTTTSAKETANPFWDEHFLFTLDQNSSEVLFELYDKSKPAGENFLGLGIVGISELRRVPSQRQIITLQSRPLEYDNITGSLTVEFLYMEGSQIPVTADSQMATEFSQQNRIVEKNSRITSDGRVITTTTIKRSPTTETKTRHLERQAVLAIEEKLKLLEQSPPKPLDESMVEFLRSQISNGCSGAAPVQQALRDGHFSDGSAADMMPSAHIPISPEASSQPLFAKDCDALTLLPSNMSGGSPKQDGCRRETPDADIPPPLPSSPPPNVSGRQRMASSSTDDNSSLVVGGEFGLEGPSTTDGLLNGERQMVTVILTASPQTKTSERSVLGSSSESTTSDCGDLYQNVAARKWAEPEADGSYGTEPRNSGGFPFPRADQNGNIRHDDGSSLTEAALKELEAKGRSPTATKSTLIIHSVQREVACPSFKSDETPLSISPSSLRKQDHNSVERSASSSCSEAEGEGASEKPKKRTLLGKIRKRLSFKKNRSKSVEVRPDAESASRSSSRSVSTDRAKSVPLGRNSHLDVPGARNNGSTRSSISEGSGISAASSRTFVSDKSLLVVEAKEDGVLRHYLIPPSLAHRSKWRRKGVKLHIYNDHVFVAKHLPGGTACHICARLLTRRLGKQGYMCRGCNLLCHKSCHVKTETVCKNSSVGTMQMEPVEDPHPPRMKAS
uniref:Putative intracellular signal transduction n=1 Tax=Ixodes ricinus TaxID=34613 RepID=A0A131Y855_IXORI